MSKPRSRAEKHREKLHFQMPKLETGPVPVGGFRMAPTDPDTTQPGQKNPNLVGLDEVSAGLGFDRVRHIPGSTYKDSSTIIVVPERSPFFHKKVLGAWMCLIAPMNQKRTPFLFTTGHEVGKAYDDLISTVLADPGLNTWKYVLTLESDNLPPPDAQIRLLESIEESGFDAMSGIYFTKGDYNMPMAYGDPVKFKSTGVLDFAPRDIRAGLANGHIMEVNGIAMGCALWRLDLFRELAKPWFVTVADVIEGKGAVGFTQDLYFCQRAKLAGKRFGVDLRVRVGHMDLNTGDVY